MVALTAALGAWAPSSFAQGSAPKLTTLYNFTGLNGDGAYVLAGVLVGSNGSLYGTAVTGGNTSCPVPGGCGIVFELTPPAHPGGAWAEAALYSFAGGSDGASPNSGLAFGKNGVLYGTTYYGGLAGCAGNFGCGTVFKLAPPTVVGGPWTETVLYRFMGGSDGANPEAGLAIGAKGVLYGSTMAGGNTLCFSAGCGTVFQLNPSGLGNGHWTETVLHIFTGGSDGQSPRGGTLAIDANGVLYGTTQDGGIPGCSGEGCGTIFALTPPRVKDGPWTEDVLYRFTGAPNDGAFPFAGLSLDASGSLFGTTTGGGSGVCPVLAPWGCGTMFRLKPTSPGGPWTEAVFSAPGGNAAAFPIAGLAIAANGALYGAAAFGGPSNPACPNMACGLLFKLVPPSGPGGAWTGATLHSFNGADGATPFGTLAIGGNGEIYGTTYSGGSANFGTVFELTP